MSEFTQKYSRQIAFVRIGADGQVSDVCGASGTWPARTARHVVEDLELGLHAYHVSWEGITAEVVDASDGQGRYLAAQLEGERVNLLLHLPRF